MANSLGDMVVRILGDISDFDKKLGEAEKKAKSTTENLGKMGKSMTLFVTAPLLGIGAAALKASADMEMLEANFTTMLGSATRAKSLLAQLKDFAARTPFSLKDLSTASQTLMQFGVNVDDIMPTLKALGDVSGGNADRFSRLALAFGQTQSAGRLMGQDLLQMINAGFNPLQEIAKTTGVSMAVLKEQMEKGAITSDMIAESFKRASASGGQFFGGMERGSKTLQGQVSTLMDELAGLGREFGTILLPIAKDMVLTLTGLAKQFQGLSESSKGMVVTVAALAAAVGPLVFMLSKLPAIIEGTRLAMALLSANPVILGLTAVAVAGIAIANAFNQARANFSLYEKARAASATQEERLRALAAAQKVIDTDDLILKRARIESGNKELTMQQALVDVDYEAYKQAVQTVSTVTKLVQAYENKVIEAEAAAVATVESNKADLSALGTAKEATFVNHRLANAIKGRVEWEEIAIALKEGRGRRADEAALFAGEEQITVLEEQVDEVAELRREIDLLRPAYSNVGKEIESVSTKFAAWMKENQQGLSDADSILGGFGGLVSKTANLYDESMDQRVDAINRERDASINALDEKTMGEEAYWAAVDALTKEAAQKAYAIEKASFDTQKGFALAQAAIDGAAAVIKSLSAAPFPFNLALAGGTAILTGAQLAIINARKPPAPPAFAEGGIVMPSAGGTLAQVAEAGQPEVIFPLDELKRFLGGAGRGAEGGDIRLVVNIDSQPILEKIFPATRNRTVLISSGAVV